MKTGRRGFSLVEVLVALGVFAFAVVGLLIAYNAALSAAREVRRESEVRRVLEDRVAEWEGVELEASEKRIESRLPGVVLVEKCERHELVDDERNIFSGFWKITLVAQWEDSGEPQSMEAEFLRYQP